MSSGLRPLRRRDLARATAARSSLSHRAVNAPPKSGFPETAAPSRPCWVCGALAYPASDYAAVRLNRCAGCGFLFQPELPIEDLRSNHDEDYFEHYTAGEDYDSQGPQRRLEARIRLRWMRGHGCSGGRLLEVGAARGDFLAEARRAGFTPVGVEPEPSSAQEARRRSGVEMLVGWVEELDLRPASFDAVCLWHVLEHIPQPRPVLEALHRCLKPGGLLFCEVPNVGSVMARAQGDQWQYLDPGHHVGFFDPRTLRRALELTGYDKVETDTIPMFRYAPPTASTLLRRLPRRLAFSLSAGVRPRAAHPWKQDLLRAVAAKPA
jgi:2-polyprenyl-3-methyl-5-hydroxy-6-metoxy-1,4-benzoquinol methylase